MASNQGGKGVNAMYCPKKFHNYPALWDCEGAKCQWFDIGTGMCALLVIALALKATAQAANQIKVSFAK